jgi:hypothetical protein
MVQTGQIITKCAFSPPDPPQEFVKKRQSLTGSERKIVQAAMARLNETEEIIHKRNSMYTQKEIDQLMPDNDDHSWNSWRTFDPDDRLRLTDN